MSTKPSTGRVRSSYEFIKVHRDRYSVQAMCRRTNCVSRIKDIRDYECYRRIIDGCRDAAKALE